MDIRRMDTACTWLGVRLADLAASIGVGPNRLSEWRTRPEGKRTVTLSAVAGALGVDEDVLGEGGPLGPLVGLPRDVRIEVVQRRSRATASVVGSQGTFRSERNPDRALGALVRMLALQNGGRLVVGGIEFRQEAASDG